MYNIFPLDFYTQTRIIYTKKGEKKWWSEQRVK